MPRHSSMKRPYASSAKTPINRSYGGDRRQIALDLVDVEAKSPPEDVLALDEALTRFANEEPAKAELVKLRYLAWFKTRWRFSVRA